MLCMSLLVQSDNSVLISKPMFCSLQTKLAVMLLTSVKSMSC